ncbi:hypothetical protein GOODEAATRI_021673, partial [Goodea atripinnis]
SSSPALRHDSQNSSRKDGTLQKIGDFLQSSPTLLGSKAKKMMSLVSGHLDSHSASSSSSLSLRVKRGRKKLYTAEISHPMEMPPHPVRQGRAAPAGTHQLWLCSSQFGPFVVKQVTFFTMWCFCLQIMNQETDSSESDHQVIKRRLRSRVYLCLLLLLLTGRTAARRSLCAQNLRSLADRYPPEPHGPKCITEEQLHSRENRILKKYQVTDMSAQNSSRTCAQVLEEMRKGPHRYQEKSRRSLSPWEYRWVRSMDCLSMECQTFPATLI